jgi:hypothetical protein
VTDGEPPVLKLKTPSWPGMVMYICNPSTKETKVGGSSLPGQPGSHGKTLSQTTKSQRPVTHVYNPSYLEG